MMDWLKQDAAGAEDLGEDMVLVEALRSLDPATGDANYWLRFRNWVMSDAAAELARRRQGYLCVEGMQLGAAEDVVDEATGEVTQTVHAILPTHYKCRQSGVILEVESPQIWIYHDEEADHE